MATKRNTCSVQGCKERIWISVGHVDSPKLTHFCWSHYKEHIGLEKIHPHPQENSRYSLSTPNTKSRAPRIACAGLGACFYSVGPAGPDAPDHREAALWPTPVY